MSRFFFIHPVSFRKTYFLATFFRLGLIDNSSETLLLKVSSSLNLKSKSSRSGDSCPSPYTMALVRFVEGKGRALFKPWQLRWKRYRSYMSNKLTRVTALPVDKRKAGHNVYHIRDSYLRLPTRAAQYLTRKCPYLKSETVLDDTIYFSLIRPTR